MLDLTKLNSPLYEIKWLDGTVLKLGKPSQKLLTKIIGLQGINEDSPEIVDVMYGLLVDVINLNKQGKTYTIEEVHEIDVDLVAMIFEDYFNFVAEQLGESKSHQSPDK